VVLFTPFSSRIFLEIALLKLLRESTYQGLFVKSGNQMMDVNVIISSQRDAEKGKILCHNFVIGYVAR
jgi:hypothetical protein